jgi:hypothetical protein
MKFLIPTSTNWTFPLVNEVVNHDYPSTILVWTEIEIYEYSNVDVGDGFNTSHVRSIYS